MSEYEGLYTFDVDNHRYIPVGQSDEIIDCFNFKHHESTEPLIKDQKIRKAVRAWAEANDIDSVWHECASCWLRGNGLEIWLEELELEQGNYTIEELCGEEEE